MQNSKGYTMVVLDLRFGQVLMKIFSFKVEVSFIVSATVCYSILLVNRPFNSLTKLTMHWQWLSVIIL